jgi:phosphatidylglycerophosphate synthase
MYIYIIVYTGWEEHHSWIDSSVWGQICIFMHMYICIYVHYNCLLKRHICLCMYIHMNIYIYIILYTGWEEHHSWIDSSVWGQICIFMHMYICIYVHYNCLLKRHICLCMYIHMNIHIYIILYTGWEEHHCWIDSSLWGNRQTFISIYTYMYICTL